jgi:hypothetical protein
MSYLSFLALALSILITFFGPIFTAGSKVQIVEELRAEVTTLKGEIKTLNTESKIQQVTVTDVQWIKRALEDNNKAHEAILKDLSNIRSVVAGRK